MEITVTGKIIFVDGVPDCFLTPKQSLEHLESWGLAPVDVNVGADAFADGAAEAYIDSATIRHDCFALGGRIEKLKKAAINSAGRDVWRSCADQSPRNEPATPVSGPPFPARQDLVILDESDIVWQKWFVLTQPNRVRRRANPMSLAESLSAEGGQPCPIPFTHDRLHEVHHWWHEMAHYYHEPEPFRYRIGAFVQAARSVTYMLQKEKGAFDDFDWYMAWVEKAKHDAVLSWINDARTNFVHRQALEPNSWMELRCIGNPRQRPEEEDEEDEYGHPLRFKVNPFVCTHEHIGRPWPTDHCHEYERHWEIEGLPGRELLDACADVYDRLDGLVSEAHKRLKAETLSFRRDGSPRALPCMEEIAKHRIVRSVMKDGREVWGDEPAGLHSH